MGTFYDGMPNVNEELNKLADGIIGRVSSDWNATVGVTQILNKPNVVIKGDPITVFSPPSAGGAAGTGAVSSNLSGGAVGTRERLLQVAGRIYMDTVVRPGGYLRWVIGASFGVAGDSLSIDYDGITTSNGRFTNVTASNIQVGAGDASGDNVIWGTQQVQGMINLRMPTSANFYVAAGAFGNAAACAVNLAANTSTGRSLNAGGTINASGADYAEYLIKALLCGTIVPGQIVGIDADGRLTDKWDRAITFMTKSTSPCLVGGDSWARHIGTRPSAPTRIPPSVEHELVSPAVPADADSGTDEVPAVYRTVVTAPGDTDAEWAAKEAAHAAAAAAFDVELEQLRQTVDRIAFAGQVPVNVRDAAPGQYIVPIQDGEGIAGAAMHLADMSMVQYAIAVGKVIAIEDDGRARIIVKVA